MKVGKEWMQSTRHAFHHARFLKWICLFIDMEKETINRNYFQPCSTRKMIASFRSLEKKKNQQQSMKYFASLGTSASTAEKELLNTSVLYHLIVEMLPLRVDGHVIGSTFGLFTKKELSEPKKNCSAWCKLASIDDLNCEYPKLELFCCFFCYLT